MKAKEFLSELFDPKKALPYEWYGKRSAHAELDDGRELRVTFFPDPGTRNTRIEFGIDDQFKMTGKGDVSTVFATVIAAITEFASGSVYYKPTSFYFTASEKSRAKMYDTLAKRVAKQLGWHIIPYDEMNADPKYQEARDNGGFVFALEPGTAPAHRQAAQKPQHSKFIPVFYVYTVEFPELPAYKIIAKTSREAEEWVMGNIPEYKDVDLMGVFASKSLPAGKKIIDTAAI